MSCYRSSCGFEIASAEGMVLHGDHAKEIIETQPTENINRTLKTQHRCRYERVGP